MGFININMKLNEALQILKNNNYLVESPMGSTEFDKKYLSHYYDVNKDSFKKRSTDNFTSNKYGTDEMGIKWLFTKKKDKFTIYMAALDGYIKYADTKEYKKIKTIDDLNEFLSNRKEYADVCESIYSDLSDLINQKSITLYRGIKLDYVQLKQYISSKKELASSETLLKLFNNTNKEYNSYATTLDSAEAFIDEDKPYIIIQGDASTNDINWAFTAYLRGTYTTYYNGKVGYTEDEINVNNIKELKNLKIIKKKLPKLSSLKQDSWITIKNFDKQTNLFDLQNSISLISSFKTDQGEVYIIDLNGIKTCTTKDCKRLTTWGKNIEVVKYNNKKYIYLTKNNGFNILYDEKFKECINVDNNYTILFPSEYDYIKHPVNDIMFILKHENNDPLILIQIGYEDIPYIYSIKKQKIIYKIENEDDINKLKNEE